MIFTINAWRLPRGVFRPFKTSRKVAILSTVDTAGGLPPSARARMAALWSAYSQASAAAAARPAMRPRVKQLVHDHPV